LPFRIKVAARNPSTLREMEPIDKPGLRSAHFKKNPGNKISFREE